MNLDCTSCKHFFVQPNNNETGFCEQEKNFVECNTLACINYEADTSRGELGEIKDQTKVAPADLNGLTAGQQEFLNMVDSGVNVYLAGVGGTGKSYVLEKLIEKCEKDGKQIIACAPTGIAALNIGGSTIHRVLKIKPEDTLSEVTNTKLDKNSPLKNCDLLIVDEISMCRCDLFDYLSQTLKLAAKKRRRKNQLPVQLVVVGDFSQLPPVIREEDRMLLELKYGYDVGNGYAFMGQEWASWHFHKVQLNEVIRQRDKDFAAALEAVRRGSSEGLRWIEDHAGSRLKNPIYLYGKNSSAETRNRHQLDKIKEESTVYAADVQGEVKPTDMATVKELELKPGARVMALINNPEDGYMNGSLGTVSECNLDSVQVEFDNGNSAKIPYHKWSITRPVVKEVKNDANQLESKIVIEEIGSFKQLPLKLAYALTIHKAQGQTFDTVKIHPLCWDPGQLYTALSRAVSIEGLSLDNEIPDKSMVTSQDVLDFYDNKPPKHRPTTVLTNSNTPELENILTINLRAPANIIGDAEQENQNLLKEALNY